MNKPARIDPHEWLSVWSVKTIGLVYLLSPESGFEYADTEFQKHETIHSVQQPLYHYFTKKDDNQFEHAPNNLILTNPVAISEGSEDIPFSALYPKLKTGISGLHLEANESCRVVIPLLSPGHWTTVTFDINARGQITAIFYDDPMGGRNLPAAILDILENDITNNAHTPDNAWRRQQDAVSCGVFTLDALKARSKGLDVTDEAANVCRPAPSGADPQRNAIREMLRRYHSGAQDAADAQVFPQFARAMGYHLMRDVLHDIIVENGLISIQQADEEEGIYQNRLNAKIEALGLELAADLNVFIPHASREKLECHFSGIRDPELLIAEISSDCLGAAFQTYSEVQNALRPFLTPNAQNTDPAWFEMIEGYICRSNIDAMRDEIENQPATVRRRRNTRTNQTVEGHELLHNAFEQLGDNIKVTPEFAALFVESDPAITRMIARVSNEEQATFNTARAQLAQFFRTKNTTPPSMINFGTLKRTIYSLFTSRYSYAGLPHNAMLTATQLTDYIQHHSDLKEAMDEHWFLTKFWLKREKKKIISRLSKEKDEAGEDLYFPWNQIKTAVDNLLKLRFEDGETSDFNDFYDTFFNTLHATATMPHASQRADIQTSSPFEAEDFHEGLWATFTADQQEISDLYSFEDIEDRLQLDGFDEDDIPAIREACHSFRFSEGNITQLNELLASHAEDDADSMNLFFEMNRLNQGVRTFRDFDELNVSSIMLEPRKPKLAGTPKPKSQKTTTTKSGGATPVSGTPAQPTPATPEPSDDDEAENATNYWVIGLTILLITVLALGLGLLVGFMPAIGVPAVAAIGLSLGLGGAAGFGALIGALSFVAGMAVYGIAKGISALVKEGEELAEKPAVEMENCDIPNASALFERSPKMLHRLSNVSDVGWVERVCERNPSKPSCRP